MLLHAASGTGPHAARAVLDSTIDAPHVNHATQRGKRHDATLRVAFTRCVRACAQLGLGVRLSYAVVIILSFPMLSFECRKAIGAHSARVRVCARVVRCVE